MVHMSKNKSESVLIETIGNTEINQENQFLSDDSTDLKFKEIHAPLKRRKFLGLGMFGLAGITISSLSSFAENVSTNFRNSPLIKMFTGIEKSYWERTDKFEIKKELIKTAWKNKDFRQVRALANSIRISSNQARIDNLHLQILKKFQIYLFNGRILPEDGTTTKYLVFRIRITSKEHRNLLRCYFRFLQIRLIF